MVVLRDFRLTVHDLGWCHMVIPVWVGSKFQHFCWLQLDATLPGPCPQRKNCDVWRIEALCCCFCCDTYIYIYIWYIYISYVYIYIYIIYVLDCVMTFIGHTFADLGSMWLVIWRIPPCFFSPIPQVDPTDLPPIRSNEKCLDRSPPFPYGCFLKGAIGGRDSSVGFSNEVITPMDLGASKKIDDAMVLFI